ncbi:uncharacterized protein LOC141852916 [Brevipalpus obovatus]|uniref:uncharacterized protein LOC141852916 n=1 Tax=Brevipalpus obovatus TaxID=246614 RepID=UPI003D9F199E
MRTHLNQHLNGLIQNSVELRERRLLIFGMRSLSVLQVIFLFVSGAFAFRYVALASTRHSNVAVVTHKSHSLIGSNSSYRNGINSSNENAIDSDGHANVVKSISSLLSESLNKSIGHFKYIQEIDENSNKVNLSTITFNETSPTSTTPCKQSVNYDDDNSSSASSSEEKESTKVSIYPNVRNYTKTTIPMTNYAEVTTNLPMITIDLEEDLRESRQDESKTELKDLKDVPTVDLRLVNHSTLVKVPVNRVTIRNRWNSTTPNLNETRFDDDYESTSYHGQRKASKPEDVPLFPFGARFLSDSFRKTEAISLTKPDDQPSGYQSSTHYVPPPPRSFSHKLSSTDSSNHHSEHARNSTKFICVEIINGEVRHPIFHKEVFPELHTPSLIMPTIPRVPMKYETYVSYNLHHTNKSDSDLTTAADRTERERSKFYADQYRPINLDSIEYLRKYPEPMKHNGNTPKLAPNNGVRTSHSRNYDPKSGYIPVSSKLSVENLGSSNPGSSPSSSQVSSTKQVKIEPIVKPGPGIVLPGSSGLSTRSKNSLKNQQQLSSSIDIKHHHQHKTPKVPPKPHDYSVEGVIDEEDSDDIPVDIPNHQSFNDQPISVPTPIPPSSLLGLMDTMHDQKTLSDLLNTHDLLNHHDLSMNPLSDTVENRPASDYIVKQYNSLKNSGLQHSMKDTIAHYNALNRPITSPYKLSSPEHGIIYYEPQYGFNHDPAMVSPYLTSLQGTFAGHKNRKASKRTKSRRTQSSSGARQSRFLSRVTPEDYKNYRHFSAIPTQPNSKLLYPYNRLSSSTSGTQSMGSKYFLVPSIPAALTAKSAKRKRSSGKTKRNDNQRSRSDQIFNSPSVAESIDMPVKCLQGSVNCDSSSSDDRRHMIKFKLEDALSRT